MSVSEKDFNRLVHMMPNCMAGGFDPLAITTIGELINWAEIELDLTVEGQDGFNPKHAPRIRKFISQCKALHNRSIQKHYK